MTWVKEMRIIGELSGIEIGDNVGTHIMGIINLSPGSFYQRSVKTTSLEIQSQLEKLIEEKADFIDVGAISTAPSFLYNEKDNISETTEIERLALFFNIYHGMGITIPISVDTQSAKTANYALSKGATIINDISGFKSDPRLPSVISDYNASAIVMACRKRPGDVFRISEIITELKNSLDLGLDADIERTKMVIDPGLGGWVPQRHIEDDYLIISNLLRFRRLNQCILLGISRKSFIGKVLKAAPEKRLWGSLAATSIAVLKGVHVIRTHDVKETKDACLVVDFLRRFNEKETS